MLNISCTGGHLFFAFKWFSGFKEEELLNSSIGSYVKHSCPALEVILDF
jgi:hypothetical protein